MYEVGTVDAFDLVVTLMFDGERLYPGEGRSTA